MAAPTHPKIFHIVHVDRLASILATGGLVSDARVSSQGAQGTTIGMHRIKQRRLSLELGSQPGLHVGECVPFYFCPRSVMLYLIYKRNHPDLDYRGGQGSIIHLEADLAQTVAWAASQDRRWAFTLGNAGAKYFEDRADLSRLNEIDWAAVAATQWSGPRRDAKQSEFLLEEFFPWELAARIGVHSQQIYNQVQGILTASVHRPHVEILSSWYYP